MKTRVLAADEAGAIQAAAELLRTGGVVALPSETVYGLAADALSAEAVAGIFEAKERPFFDPLIVHLPDEEWFERVVEVAPSAREVVAGLAKTFWPGPLTMVLPRRPIVPDLVTAGLGTVAVRRPAHQVFAAVLRVLDRPLAAPSANRFGRISPTCAAHVESELGGRIALILDGGPTGHGIESTIVRPVGGELQILRPGPVTPEMLAAHGIVRILREESETPSAPGALPSHYAPRTPLTLEEWPRPVGGRCGLLAWGPPVEREGWAEIEVLSADGSLVEAAARLFGCLRRLDDSGVERIVAETVPEDGLGLAIMDRLRRAASS